MVNDVDPLGSAAHETLRPMVEQPLPANAWRDSEVGATLTEALSEPRARLRRASTARVGGPDFGLSTAEKLERAIVVVDEAGHWLMSRIGPTESSPGDVPTRCAMLVLRRAQQTAQAISLLLSRGYVTDALARWRAVHELAATAVLLARYRDELLAERYLAQVNLVPKGGSVRYFV